MEENLDSFDSETMLKLKKKGRLIGDVSKIFEQISRKMEVYKCCGFRGRSFVRKSLKSVMRDFSKGLRMIDLKIPVFVELPKLKTVSSDGTYSVTKEGDSAPCEYDVPSLNPSNQIEGQKQEYIDFHDTDNL